MEMIIRIKFQKQKLKFLKEHWILAAHQLEKKHAKI